MAGKYLEQLQSYLHVTADIRGFDLRRVGVGRESEYQQNLVGLVEGCTYLMEHLPSGWNGQGSRAHYLAREDWAMNSPNAGEFAHDWVVDSMVTMLMGISRGIVAPVFTLDRRNEGGAGCSGWSMEARYVNHSQSSWLYMLNFHSQLGEGVAGSIGAWRSNGGDCGGFLGYKWVVWCVAGYQRIARGEKGRGVF